MSERNGDLPNGWVKATIDELCDLNPKHDNELSDETLVSFVPMAAVSDVLGTIIEPQVRMLGEVRKGYTHFADGDVIFAKITPCMENGKAASVRGMTNGLACGTTEFYVFRSHGAIDQDFLFHFIRQVSYRRAARATMQSGVGQARVPKEFVLKTEMLVPPLAEQRRIVTKIEALQERSRRAREALSEVGPLLEQFRQSVLAAAFCGDLTADWRATHPNVEPASELLMRIRAERRRRWQQAELVKYEAKGQKPPKNWLDKYEEPEPVDDSELSELPEGWCWTTLGELALIDSGEAFKKKDYGTSGVRLLQIANVGFGKTHWQQRNYLPEHFAKSHGFLLLDNTDVAMALNRPILDGQLKVTRIIDDDLPAILYQRVGRLRTAVSGIVDYLFAFMRSPLMLQQVERNLQGTDQPYINTSDIPDIIVPLAPLAEQTVILTFVSRSLDVEGAIEEQRSEVLTGLDHLDQTILAKAFRGELVPQDPSDEPASVLLERIRAQRKQPAVAPKQTSKSHQTSKLEKKSSRLGPQQLTLAEVLRTAD